MTHRLKIEEITGDTLVPGRGAGVPGGKYRVKVTVTVEAVSVMGAVAEVGRRLEQPEEETAR